MWDEWEGRDGSDTGIDLVAEQTDRWGGGLCAVQCKVYGEGSRVAKGDLDKFISKSSHSRYTARLLVSTGAELGPKTVKTIEGVEPRCEVLTVEEMDRWVADWRDCITDPESLVFDHVAHVPRRYQRGAVDGVIAGVRGARPGQAGFAVRDRQVGGDTLDCGGAGRGRRTGVVSGAVDRADGADDAGVGPQPRRGAPLHRDLLRHPHRAEPARTPPWQSWRCRSQQTPKGSPRLPRLSGVCCLQGQLVVRSWPERFKSASRSHAGSTVWVSRKPAWLCAIVAAGSG